MAEKPPASAPVFTGRKRSRENRRGVVIAEQLARLLITAGGMATILAISLIVVFLVWVVAPLFYEAEVSESQMAASTSQQAATRVAVGVDEDQMLVWELTSDWQVRLLRLDSGEEISVEQPFSGERPTVLSFDPSGGGALFGFADGTVRPGNVGFSSKFLGAAEIPAGLESLESGDSRPYGAGMIVRTPTGQLRTTEFRIDLADAIATGRDSAIVKLDHSNTPAGLSFAALHADGALEVYRVRTRTNLLTGAETVRVRSASLPVARADAEGVRLALGGVGNHLYVIADSGQLDHYDLRDFGAPAHARTQDLLESREAGNRITALTFLIGKTSLIVGDSSGGLTSWFPVNDPDGGVPQLTAVHDLPAETASPVTSLSPSSRSRLLAAGHEDGSVRLLYVTSSISVITVDLRARPDAVCLAPKEDGLLAFDDRGVTHWEIDPKHPEATLAGLFSPVWYESAAEPAHVWQSVGGTDDYEPKFGLLPLVVGTLKATLYSMLFGAPLALLAAIFCSEFLSSRMRAPVKSTIELMASLPSVVLGFLAALVFAPVLQEIVPATLASLIVVPMTLLLGAYTWQLLPNRLAVRWAGFPRLASVTLCLPLGLFFSWLLGPLAERLLFAGDVRLWLDGQIGSALGGLVYLLLPVSGMLVAFVSARYFAPLLRSRSSGWSQAKVARVDFLKFIALAALALLVAVVLAGIFSGVGFDARGSVFGTYDNKNALLVGFVMGFAIIPIIFTLADDALTEVPRHLREASLGAGATQWQTATRVVVPTAMSGLFSAVMIGLGRAVGETMIVLMAAGSTAIMDWSVFNGFRTLSANIATELPEAVRDSTHYRTLFLAALVLFAMTFVLNTVAEAVRRHFRRKTHAL